MATTIGTGNVTVAAPSPLPATITAANVALTGSSGGNVTFGAITTSVPSTFASQLPTGATFLGATTVTNAGTAAFSASGATLNVTLATAPAAGSSCFIGVSPGGALPYTIVPATVSGTTLTASTGAFSLNPGSTSTFVAYCVPGLAGATSVPVTSGTAITVPAGSSGFGTTTATINGLTGGNGTVNVTPISTSAPTGFSAFTPPTGGTVYGYIGVQNPASSTISGTSATIVVTAPSTVAAGSSCFLASATPAGGSYTSGFAPTSVSGSTYTFANPSAISLPGGQAASFAFYCVAPPAGSTPTSIPAGPVNLAAGTFGLPAGSSVSLGGTNGGTVNVVPFSTATPAAAILPTGGLPAGSTVLGQFAIQSPTGISSQQGGSITLPTTSPSGSSCTLYTSVNGAPATAGATAKSTGTNVTFAVPAGNGIAAGYTVTVFAACVATATPAPPAALTSPTAFPAPVGGYYQIPTPNTVSAPAGTAITGNLSLGLPAGTTVASAITASTITAGTTIATPAPTVVAQLGLPVYDGTTASSTAAFGGTALYYGSFVFSNSGNSLVSANSGGQGNSNILPTIPGLTLYAQTNPTKNYYLAVYDPTSGKYQTQPVTSPYSGSQIVFPIPAQTGTGAVGTPTGTVNNNNNVNFNTTASSGFVPGQTYGYVVITK